MMAPEMLCIYGRKLREFPVKGETSPLSNGPIAQPGRAPDVVAAGCSGEAFNVIKSVFSAQLRAMTEKTRVSWVRKHFRTVSNVPLGPFTFSKKQEKSQKIPKKPEKSPILLDN